MGLFCHIYISVFWGILFNLIIWIWPGLFHNQTALILIIIIFSVGLTCFLNWPQKTFDIEKELQKQELELAIVNKEFVPILPSSDIVAYDKENIESRIKETLIKFDFGDGKIMSEKDSIHYKLIDDFFSLGYAKFKSQIKVDSRLYRYLHVLSESVTVRYITYSPDYNYFSAYIDFEGEKGDKECNIVFAEKLESGIHLYDFNRGLEGKDSKNNINYYKFLTGWRESEPMINNFTRHTLTLDFDHPYYKINENGFWKDPNLFSLINIEGESFIRFKTTNIDYHNQEDRIIDYELRKNLKIE